MAAMQLQQQNRVRLRTARRAPYVSLPEDRLNELGRLGERLLRGSRLLVASNRGPVQYAVGPDGELER